MLESYNHMLLLVTVLGALSIVSTRLSFRAGAPVLLVFLLVGLLAGEDGIGGIVYDDANGAYVIGMIALALILFDSGFGTSVGTLRRAAAPAVALATVGVAVSTVLFAAVAWWWLALPWIEALLLGAILASTDAAAVFFLLRAGGLALRDRVRSTLEIESGTNDPMAVFLVLALLPLAQAGSAAFEPAMAIDFVLQMGVGLATGIVGGVGMTALLNKLDLDGGLHPLLAAMIALALFAVTNLLHGSGFLAVYVAGLVAGHRARQRVNELRRFQHGVTWLAQIAMFLTLGLYATPSEFPGVALPALGLGAFLIFVARPIAVWLCLLPFRASWQEITFIGVIGLRGAVSILLAIVPIIGGLEHGRLLFNLTFLIVLICLIVQGWGLAPLARWLGLVVPGRTGPIDRIELDLPLEGAHELVAYRLAADSPLITQRRMPRWMHPALVVRDGRSIRNVRVDKLQKGDLIYVFVRPHRVPLLDRLVASPRVPDKSDREFYGDFAVEIDTPILELAEFYGAEVHAENRALTVAEFLQREFGLGIEPGDRVGLGTIELIVRDRDRFGRVTDVGLSVIAKTRRA